MQLSMKCPEYPRIGVAMVIVVFCVCGTQLTVPVDKPVCFKYVVNFNWKCLQDNKAKGSGTL